MADDPRLFRSVEDLGREYASGDLSPVDVTEACLARIEEQNEALQAFSLVDGKRALTQARESEARWRAGTALSSLDGIPVGIKDLVLTKDWPTVKGSAAVSSNGPWTEDGPSVARIREAGAVLLGKTTTCDHGWKAVTDNPATGLVTRNPWDETKTPGGSSGGSAAALASGMCVLALGTDGGGSIRVPASFSSLFGLKPTFGRVPAWPPSGFATLAHVGPMARTVRDVRISLMFLPGLMPGIGMLLHLPPWILLRTSKAV